jgi:hypothetical protein
LTISTTAFAFSSETWAAAAAVVEVSTSPPDASASPPPAASPPAAWGFFALAFGSAKFDGTIKGKTSNNFGGGRATFQGVFRLPFAGNIPIPELGGATLRQAFCPLTPDKNPFTDVYGGLDLAYVDTLPNGTLTGRCIDIQPNELSLGTPTVRFDIYFD